MDIYGRVRTFAGRSLNNCPFRYQGQYHDSETGLYYNRFRYYDPDTGNYISQDPIGLAGNNPTFYGYVKDSNTFIDHLGLNGLPKGKKINRTVYRYEYPSKVSTTWDTHSGNINADHRYTKPGIGGVYGANSPKTAIAEVTHGVKNDPNLLKGRIVVSKRFQLKNVLDLTDSKVRTQLGIELKDITNNNYKITHQLGDFAKTNGYDGILAPSARNSKGSNLITFKGNH